MSCDDFAIVDDTLVARIPVLPAAFARRILARPNARTTARRLFVRSRYLRVALELASRALYETCVAEVGAGESSPRVWRSVLKYVLRMCDRTTPFGMFTAVAATAIGADAPAPHVADELRLAIRPDMAWCAAVSRDLEDGLAPALRTYYFNDAVLERGDRLLIFRTRHTDDDTVEQEALSIKASDTLKALRSGLAVPATRQRIEDLLIAAGYPPERAGGFTARLIELHVLLPARRLSPIGDPVDQLIAMADASSDASAVRALSELREGAQRIAAAPGFAVTPEAVESYRQRIEQIRAVVPGSHAVQIDAFARIDGALPPRIRSELRLFARVLASRARRRTMSKLVDAFYERYGSFERWTPLLDFADPKAGLTISDAMWDAAGPDREIERLAAGWALEAVRRGTTELEASQRDVERILHGRESELPDTFEFGFEIVASGAEAMGRGEFRIVPSGIVVPGTGRTLGRFLYGMPPRTRAALASDGAPAGGVVDAELVYKAPDERMDNVVVRPRISAVEVQLGLFDGTARRIDVGDLLLRVENGRFALFSQSLGARVRLRETHVLNPGDAGPVARLLALLSRDAQFGFASLMPPIALTLGFMPRVTHGRLILTLATWFVEARALVKNALDDTMHRLRAERMLPRRVFLCEADNRLLLDLDAADSRAMLAQAAERYRPEQALLLEEDLDGRAWLPSKSGAHRAEFLVTVRRVVKDGALGNGTAAPRGRPAPPLVLFPGGRWTYAIVRAWRADDVDLLLRDRIPRLIGELRAAGAVDRWHFVRYAEQGRPALRLRLRAADPREPAAVERCVRTTLGDLASERIIHSFALATYEPELDRYGGADSFDTVEAFFTDDSDEVVRRFGAGMPPGPAERIFHAIDAFAAVVPATGAAYGWLDVSPERFAADAPTRALIARVAESLIASDCSPVATAVIAGLQSLQAAMSVTVDEAMDAVHHMHFNRFGLSEDEERRARQVTRAAVRRAAALRSAQRV